MIFNLIIFIKYFIAKFLIFILLQLVNFTKIKNTIKEQSTSSLPYHKLQVDLPLPIIQHPKNYDYKNLLIQYKNQYNKELKPVRRRIKLTFDTSIICPFCNAPYNYIYDNNGAKGQFLCKVCNSTFHAFTTNNSLSFKCPYCHHILTKIKERSQFYIYKCINEQCFYYLKNLYSLNKKELLDYNNNPHNYKLHYIFRDFKFNLGQLLTNSPNKPKIDIARAHKPMSIISIVLTFFGNYGLSSRMIKDIMFNIFNVKISHQTVLNYVNYATYILNPYISSFKHLISSTLTGDETYIKIKGLWNYLFFIFDPKKQIVLANFISSHRDTFSAASAILQAINSAINKFIFNELSFNKPVLIFDGNPIYQLAQLFFALNNIFFDIKQVIGLRNINFVSTVYRPYKQQIERLIRIFKDSYRHTNGFDNINGAVSFTVMFTTYFNFLRPNKALNWKVPIELEELKAITYTPAKWIKLIELAQNYALNST